MVERVEGRIRGGLRLFDTGAGFVDGYFLRCHGLDLHSINESLDDGVEERHFFFVGQMLLGQSNKKDNSCILERRELFLR